MRLSFRQFPPFRPMGRRVVFTLVASGVVVAGLFALRGPQGVQALLARHREIRRLEEENAAQVLENQRRRERIERLEHSTTEQEIEIRKQLKLLRPGETTFILPEAPKPDPSKDAAKPADVDSPARQ